VHLALSTPILCVLACRTFSMFAALARFNVQQCCATKHVHPYLFCVIVRNCDDLLRRQTDSMTLDRIAVCVFILFNLLFASLSHF
jgi:hypothetical protein